MLVTFDDIITTSVSEDYFLHVFEQTLTQLKQPFLEGYPTLLSACYRNPSLAPTLKGKSSASVVQAWSNKYCQGFENRISQRISKPPSTVVDPVVSTIIHTRLTGLTTECLEQIQYAHRLSMSAENILGLLLEEFLAEQLADFGWICCWGEVVRHVDFCHADGSLLQIKNRSNSENSSSSRVRIDRPIEKWYRVNAQTGIYQWEHFNQKYKTDRFSEENFIRFIQKVLTANPKALAIEVTNPWQAISKSSD